METEVRKKGSEKGWVYVLSNKCIQGLVKVGFSKRDVSERLKEINSGTGVPVPFDLEFEVLVENPHGHELRVHQILDSSRLRDRKEFFVCPVKEAIDAVKSAVGQGPLEETKFLGQFEKPTFARQKTNRQRNLPRRAFARWNDEEIQFLKSETTDGAEPEALAKKLERNLNSILMQIERQFEELTISGPRGARIKRYRNKAKDDAISLINDYIVIANNFIAKTDATQCSYRKIKKINVLTEVVKFAIKHKENKSPKQILKMVRLLDATLNELK
jgi:hypothetical protein